MAGWRQPSPTPSCPLSCLSRLPRRGRRAGAGPLSRHPGPTARPFFSLGLRTMGQCEGAWEQSGQPGPLWAQLRGSEGSQGRESSIQRLARGSQAEEEQLLGSPHHTAGPACSSFPLLRLCPCLFLRPLAPALLGVPPSSQRPRPGSGCGLLPQRLSTAARGRGCPVTGRPPRACGEPQEVASERARPS